MTLRSALRSPVVWLLALLVVATGVRLLWIDLPADTYSDEIVYVNAARVILGGEPHTFVFVTFVPGIDPNVEHPPLGKLLIAGSMLLLGDGPVGWRMPGLIAGVITLLAVYGIVRALGGRPMTGVVASALVALDPLSLVVARTALLDGPMTALLLTGAWLGIRRQWVLAGVVLAIATLVKLSAALGLLALGIWIAWVAWRGVERQGLRVAPRPLLLLCGTFGISFLGGLWLLDLAITRHTNPLEHLSEMLAFGMRFRGGSAAPPGGLPFASPPWGWLLGFGQWVMYSHARAASLLPEAAALAQVDLTVVRLALNPVLVAGYLPAAVLAIIRIRRDDADLERWGLLWVGALYIPWVLIALVSARPMFLHYMAPVVPGMAITLAAALWRLPRWVTWLVLAGCVTGLAIYFPIRGTP